MRDSSSIRGSVFWPGAIILGGLVIIAFFLVFDQPVELAVGASLSLVVLAFVSLMAGAGRTEVESLDGDVTSGEIEQPADQSVESIAAGQAGDTPPPADQDAADGQGGN